MSACRLDSRLRAMPARSGSVTATRVPRNPEEVDGGSFALRLVVCSAWARVQEARAARKRTRFTMQGGGFSQ